MIPVSFSFPPSPHPWTSPPAFPIVCSRPQDKLRPDGRPSDTYIHQMHTSIGYIHLSDVWQKAPAVRTARAFPLFSCPSFFPEGRKIGTVFSITKKTRRKAASGSVLSFFMPCPAHYITDKTIISHSKTVQSSRLSYTADVGYFLPIMQFWADSTCNLGKYMRNS